MVLRVRPAPTRFPTNILGQNTLCILCLVCDARGTGWRRDLNSEWYASTHLLILTMNRTTTAIILALSNYRRTREALLAEMSLKRELCMIFLLPFQEPILCIVFGLSLRETKMVVKGVRNTAISLAICILVGEFEVGDYNSGLIINSSLFDN